MITHSYKCCHPGAARDFIIGLDWPPDFLSVRCCILNKGMYLAGSIAFIFIHFIQ